MLHISRKSLNHILEGFAFALVLLVLAVFSFAMRLSQGPIDLAFAKNYILGALSDPNAGIKVDVADLKLSWPDLGGEILLDLNKVSLKSAVGARLSVDRAQVGVAQGPLLVGIVRPQTITLIEPRLRFTRATSPAGEVAVSSDAESGNALLDFLGAAMIDTQDGRETVFTRLRKVSIENANIRYKDQQAGWFINLFQSDVSFTREKNKLNYRLSVPGGVVENTNLFQETIVLDNTVFEGIFDRQKKQILIDTPSGEIANLPLKVQGVFDQKSTGFEGAISVLLNEIEADRLDTLWPKGLENTSGYTWFVKDMSKGILNNIRADLPLGFSIRDDGFSLRVGFPEAKFDFENLSVDYRAPLWPYVGAKGTATYKNDNLEVTSTGGKIGALNVVKGRVYLDKLMADGVGDADIDVSLSGGLKDVFEFAKLDPINLDQKFKLDVANVKGAGTYDVAIDFPAIPDVLAEQVKVAVKAKGENVTIPNITNGLSLENAKLDVASKDAMLNVKGTGQVLGRDVILNWTRALEPQAGDPVKAKIKLNVSSDEALRKAFDAHLPEVQGVLPLDLDIIEKHDGTGSIKFQGNLTPTVLDIAPLGYKKASGVSGSVQGDITLKNDQVSQIKNMRVAATGLTLNGITLNYALDSAGKATLKSGSIVEIKSGDTSLKADFTKPAPNSLSVVASGPRVDLRPFFSSGTGTGAAGDRISLKLTAPSAVGAEQENITNLALDIDMNEFGATTGLDFKAQIGNGPVTIQYRPNATAPQKFTFNAVDAGAALRAFNIYPNIIGGTLEIFADTVQAGSRDLKGQLMMRDFRVVRAPFLARIIGALSLQGLDQTLQGKEGLPFAKLQSEFELYAQEKGLVYVFLDGRTSGSSLGLTFEGKADQGTKTVDFSGTIVPISGVNSFVTNIPVIGEILAGKKGEGVFAATYSLRGPSDNPSTLVNPLAVLTPGILRKILFERDVKMPDEKKQQAPKTKKNE